MTANSDKAWEFFGKNDPYFGVITSDKYHLENLNDDHLSAFFASGQAHIESVMSTVRTHLDSDFVPRRALDFGCGVGRLVLPLTSLCETVTGVDVSTSMLATAERICRERNVANAAFVESDDGLSRISERFNFIHSYIVFQHIPCGRGYRIFSRLIDLLEENGVGALHFTVFRKSSAGDRFLYWGRKSVPLVNGLYNLLRLGKSFNHPLMQMNEYSLRRLLLILNEKGCHHVYIRFSDHSSPRTNIYGVMLFFQKKTLPHW